MKIPRLLLPVSLALLAALVFPSCAHPQRTESIGAQQNVPSAAPLQILDDFGQPITESDIQRRMKHSRWRWLAQPAGFILGAVLIGNAVPKGDSKDHCSIYEPCSDREKFYRSSGYVVGGVIGLLFMNVAIAGSNTTRLEAVEMVREERRSAR
jgi:hypothetical protein